MWRTYFALRKLDTPPTGETDARIYGICDGIFHTRFVKADQDILTMYFTSRWGDDLYAVEDYSLKHNIPVKVIWMVIKKANRSVMEECGLLERKEDGRDE